MGSKACVLLRLGPGGLCSNVGGCGLADEYEVGMVRMVMMTRMVMMMVMLGMG